MPLISAAALVRQTAVQRKLHVQGDPWEISLLRAHANTVGKSIIGRWFIVTPNKPDCDVQPNGPS